MTKDDTSERLHSHDAELGVVAGLLMDPEAFRKAAAIVTEADFLSERYGLVFGAAASVHARGLVVDPLTTAEQLKATYDLEALGGMPFLASLFDDVPTAANIEYHAKVVREKAVLRRTLEACRQTERDVEEAGGALGNILLRAEERFAALRSEMPTGARVVTLSDLLQDPANNAEVEPAVAPIAWRGRTTLFAAREKLGKSTLASAAAAAKSSGFKFLGAAPTPGRVLYVGLEEHPADLAKRLVQFGADPDLVYILDRVGDAFADLESAVRQAAPELVVLDTLAAFVESMELDPGSATAWTPVMARLGRVARDSGAGVLLLHHSRKSDGKYRDSTAIGAGVDCILEMAASDVAGVRKFKARARWKVDGFDVRLRERVDDLPAYFELVSGELSLDAKVLLFVEHNPGCSSRALREGVSARGEDIDAAVYRLLSRGAIQDRGADRRRAFHARPMECVPDVSRVDPAQKTVA